MIKIIGIRKQPGIYENPHLGIISFRWVNEQTQVTGETGLAGMYDWIVNKKGQAYIRDAQGTPVYIFGAISSPSGQPYIRTIKDGVWTDDLLDIPLF